MHRTSVRTIALLACVALLGGCKWFSRDENVKDWSADRFYTEGKKSLADGNYEKAIKNFEQLESRYPYGPYAEQAQLEVAYAYYKYGEPQSAVNAADRFIRLHPTHPHVEYAYYLKGLAHFNTKRTFLDRFGGEPDLSDRDQQAAAEAFQAFRELVERFPDSKYSADARVRMAYLLNAQARHDVMVARFYLERGAYVAAVNRCKHVVENYQQAPAVEDALGLMAQVYTRMGLPDLAEDTTRVLRTNFPGSFYLAENASKAPREKSSWWWPFGGKELPPPSAAPPAAATAAAPAETAAPAAAAKPEKKAAKKNRWWWPFD